LEIPYGTDLAGVRHAYKLLMKRYHPDRHHDAEKKATATEIVKRLNLAYGEILKHLEAQGETAKTNESS
jgi:DnaJ-class molecular chaperone